MDGANSVPSSNMSAAVVTGSAGLIGSETVKTLAALGLDVAGIDNDMRRVFFGDEASTASTRDALKALPNYTHHGVDMRDDAAVGRIFADRGRDISLVVHTGAQPSHD